MGADDDKRKERRIPVDFWIDVDADGELYFQHAANLSVGGAYFTHTFPLELGRRVQLKFTLPGPEQAVVECKAEIVTAEGLGMGVQFIDLAPADRARIENLIHRKA